MLCCLLDDTSHADNIANEIVVVYATNWHVGPLGLALNNNNNNNDKTTLVTYNRRLETWFELMRLRANFPPNPNDNKLLTRKHLATNTRTNLSSSYMNPKHVPEKHESNK